MSEPITSDPATPNGPRPRGVGHGLRGPATLALLSLAWLAAVLWLARGTVAAGSGSLAVSAAALVLPSVVTASLVGGAAAGLLGVTPWRGRPSAEQATGTGRRAGAGRRVRAGLGVGAGLVAGLLAGGLILAAYGTGSSILVVAGTVTLAGLLGGLLATLAPRAPVAAGLAATLSAIATGFLLEIARPALKRLFGAGDTVASQVDAITRLTYVSSLVVAVIAGGVAFWYLHRTRPAARWPGYLLAGACPGLLLLVSEALTRTGGGRLLDIAKALSPADRVSLDYLGAARINHALIVLFAAAITAIMLHGRTLPAPDRDAATAADARADAASPADVASPGEVEWDGEDAREPAIRDSRDAG